MCCEGEAYFRALEPPPSRVSQRTKVTRVAGQSCSRAEKAPEAVTVKLEESLGKLKELALKTEPLTDEDIDSVIKVTKDVMALL